MHIDKELKCVLFLSGFKLVHEAQTSIDKSTAYTTGTETLYINSTKDFRYFPQSYGGSASGKRYFYSTKEIINFLINKK